MKRYICTKCEKDTFDGYKGRKCTIEGELKKKPEYCMYRAGKSSAVYADDSSARVIQTGPSEKSFASWNLTHVDGECTIPKFVDEEIIASRCDIPENEYQCKSDECRFKTCKINSYDSDTPKHCPYSTQNSGEVIE